MRGLAGEHTFGARGLSDSRVRSDLSGRTLRARRSPDGDRDRHNSERDNEGAEHRLSIAVAGSPNPRWQGHRMRVTAGSASSCFASRGKLDEFDETIAPRRRAESVAGALFRQHSLDQRDPSGADDRGVSRGSMGCRMVAAPPIKPEPASAHPPNRGSPSVANGDSFVGPMGLRWSSRSTLGCRSRGSPFFSGGLSCPHLSFSLCAGPEPPSVAALRLHLDSPAKRESCAYRLPWQ